MLAYLDAELQQLFWSLNRCRHCGHCTGASFQTFCFSAWKRMYFLIAHGRGRTHLHAHLLLKIGKVEPSCAQARAAIETFGPGRGTHFAVALRGLLFCSVKFIYFEPLSTHPRICRHLQTPRQLLEHNSSRHQSYTSSLRTPGHDY